MFFDDDMGAAGAAAPGGDNAGMGDSAAPEAPAGGDNTPAA